MLITLDSLRWDVFKRANTPFMKKFKWEKTYTHGTYTFPAHEAFFTGKLPCSYDGGPFDNLARTHRSPKAVQQWRLSNPESDQPCVFRLGGKNIIDGFNKIGFNTIGTGAVSWFNTEKPASIPAILDFKKFAWFGEYMVAPHQVKFVTEEIKKSDKYFAFINMGETHHSFRRTPNDPPIAYGNPAACLQGQQRCVEYLDGILSKFIRPLKNVDVLICSDHGECLGESGLWGHSFYHQKIIEVPSVKISI